MEPQYVEGALLFHGEKLKETEGQMVHLIIDRPESGWKISVDLGRSDLALLLAYKLKKNRRSKILLTALTESGEDREAQDFIDSVVELARIPNVQSRLAHSKEELRPPDREAPFVNLRSIQKDLDFEALRETIEIVQTPCLFVMDSGLENALI